MFDLEHHQHRDGSGPAPLFMMAAQAKWRRLMLPELLGVRTTSKLTEHEGESYSLLHEQATRGVASWALNKQL
jgi:hypothetical protein